MQVNGTSTVHKPSYVLPSEKNRFVLPRGGFEAFY